MQYFTNNEIQEIKTTIQNSRYLTYDDISSYLENVIDEYVFNGINYYSNNKTYNKLLKVSSVLNKEIYQASKLINNNLHFVFEVIEITNYINEKYGSDGVICLYYILNKCSKHKLDYIRKYQDIIKINLDQ